MDGDGRTMTFENLQDFSGLRPIERIDVFLSLHSDTGPLHPQEFREKDGKEIHEHFLLEGEPGCIL